MKNLFLKTILVLVISTSFFKSQKVLIEGFIKQPTNKKINALIIVNDTINKLAKLDSLDFTRRDKIYREKEFINSNDEKGYFKILAKPTDSLFFRFGTFFHSEMHAVSDLLKMDKIVIDPKPIPCIPIKKCNQEKPIKTYTFVGKKINVYSVDTSLYCGGMLWDSKYEAVYEIDQELLGHYPSSRMTFTAYDHASMYEYNFQNYDTILLLIREYCGDLIEKDFFPVYKAVDGRWATPVDTYMEHHYQSKKLKLRNINFEKSFGFDISSDASPRYIGYKFPKEYYKIENGKAIPIMGRYVEDLVKIWKESSEKNKE